MTAALTELAGLAGAHLAAAFLVFLRVGAAMALLPAIGEGMIPLRVRLAATIALTAVVAPGVAAVIPDLAGAELAVAAAIEVGAGLALGLALRLLVFALQIAGTIAAQTTSLSQLLGGQAVDPQPALGAVLVLGGLAFATFLGLHVKVAAMFLLSYQLLPPGQPIMAGAMSGWSVGAVADAFRLAVILAAPFALASLLYNLALGVINRAMPQLMVAFVGAPAITFGALCILALTAPLVLEVWAGALETRLADPFGAGR